MLKLTNTLFLILKSFRKTGGIKRPTTHQQAFT